MDPNAPTPDAEQIKTFRDFLANYNKLSELCFSDCVWDFTNRKVSKKEDHCAMNCAEKYLKMNQRISTRFQVNIDFVQSPKVSKEALFFCC
jgi:import inner membrane translocase subunit TIM9